MTAATIILGVLGTIGMIVALALALDDARRRRR